MPMHRGMCLCVCVCVTDKFEKVTNTYIIYIFLVLLRIAVRVLETFIVFVAHVCVYMYMCVCLYLCVCLWPAVLAVTTNNRIFHSKRNRTECLKNRRCLRPSSSSSQCSAMYYVCQCHMCQLGLCWLCDTHTLAHAHRAHTSYFVHFSDVTSQYQQHQHQSHW